MKSLFVSFVVFAVISQCYGSLYREIIPKNKDYPGKCYVEKYKMALVIGDSYQTPDMCADMICDESYELTYLGCLPTAECPEDWVTKFIPGDKDKRYPGCCDSNECYKHTEDHSETD